MADPIVSPETSPAVPAAPVATPAPAAELLDPRTRALQQDFIAAATRREAELAATKQLQAQASADLKAAQEKLAELEKKEKARAQAEMTEIQRAQAQAAEVEAARKAAEDRAVALQSQLTAREAEFSRHQEVTRNERAILGILAAQRVSPNEYEQEGLFLRAGQLQYTGEEDRQAKLTALVSGFIAQARPAAPVVPGQVVSQGAGILYTPPVIPQSPGPVVIHPPISPVPPGGTPPATPPIMEDNYTAHELIEMSRRDPQRFAQVEAARQARAKAMGVPMIRMVGAQ